MNGPSLRERIAVCDTRAGAAAIAADGDATIAALRADLTLATDPEILGLISRQAADAGRRIAELEAEVVRLRDVLASKQARLAAAEVDAERHRFVRDQYFQYFEPTRRWQVSSARGSVLHAGAASNYEDAIDAARTASTGEAGS